MLAEIIGEVVGAFNWVLSQLGWDIGSLSWVHIVLLVLAAVGILVVTRNLIGGHSGGGGSGGTVVYPQSREPRGLPTSFYTGSSRLGDFSIPKEVYNFRVPSPTPNLAELRKPVKLDMEKASQLFTMPKVTTPAPDLRVQATNFQAFSNKSSSAPGPAGPDWELARKLFVTGFKR